MRRLHLLSLLAVLFIAGSLSAQVAPTFYENLKFRQINFSRGGRSTAVAGVPSQPLTFYMGAAGGGVWKTTDAGTTWRNITDGFFEVGTVGAVAVAPSDPNVVYAGTGSAEPRGNVTPGNGVYKSVDAGKTWKNIGLKDAGEISRIQIHPKNPDLVYVAVLGNIFGPNDTRGIFRSKDGGATWQKVLFVSNKTGASDLSIDPVNPRILYAGMWAALRQPWTIDSGSADSGVYRSDDSGDTWKRVTTGLPRGMVGKTSVSVSAANHDRIFVLMEAANDEGGVFRSDNGGQSFTRTYAGRNLQQRAFYYTHIFADPKNPDLVYALNVNMMKSIDAGKTWTNVQTPHSDHHDLWINPDDPSKMILANDGGATVSLSTGQSWSTQLNQPTSEIYRIAVDTRFPYRIYGAQQDNSTVSVSSRGGGGGGGGGAGAGNQSYYEVGGGESGHIAVDPRHPNIVYAGSYGGFISKMDTDTRLEEDIRTYPEEETGQRAADMKYRFQWTAPIRVSSHNPDVVYHTSQYVHRSSDGGRTWEIISPDLSRNDKTKQEYAGGKGITRDDTGVEVYGTIFAFEESVQTAGLLWAGTDDGRMHISRDNGKNWMEITPKEMPEWGTVNSIDLSAHDPGRAHIAVNRYLSNDPKPYIFQTSDYGKTWKLLTSGTNGIPATSWVRVVREDPDRKGLLYAGTEFGLYISFDDGAHWQKFQQNLPITPVMDLMVHQKDLIVATEGRSFWILDDVSPLHQMTAQVTAAKQTLFKPRDAYRSGGDPADFYYYFSEASRDPVKIEVMDSTGATVASFTGQARGRGNAADAAAAPAEQSGDEQAAPDDAGGGDGGGGGGGGGGGFGGRGGQARVSVAAGLNKFTWNMRYAAIFQMPRGIIMWGGRATPPGVLPGKYQVKVTAGTFTQTQSFEVKGDPRVDTSSADYEEQLKLAREVAGRIKELYDTLAQIRDSRAQAKEIGERLQKAGYGDDALKAANAMNERWAELEGDITQLKGEGNQDALNYPGRLDNQWAALYSHIVGSDRKPTPGDYQRYEDLKPSLNDIVTRMKRINDSDVAKFNELVKGKGAQPIIVKK
jgi:photosystem II stability/assembly factor-like uncharacterized protein